MSAQSLFDSGFCYGHASMFFVASLRYLLNFLWSCMRSTGFAFLECLLYFTECFHHIILLSWYQLLTTSHSRILSFYTYYYYTFNLVYELVWTRLLYVRAWRLLERLKMPQDIMLSLCCNIPYIFLFAPVFIINMHTLLCCIFLCITRHRLGLFLYFLSVQVSFKPNFNILLKFLNLFITSVFTFLTKLFCFGFSKFIPFVSLWLSSKFIFWFVDLPADWLCKERWHVQLQIKTKYSSWFVGH